MELMVHIMTMIIHHPILIAIDNESFYSKDNSFTLYFIRIGVSIASNAPKKRDKNGMSNIYLKI